MPLSSCGPGMLWEVERITAFFAFLRGTKKKEIRDCLAESVGMLLGMIGVVDGREDARRRAIERKLGTGLNRWKA